MSEDVSPSLALESGAIAAIVNPPKCCSPAGMPQSSAAVGKSVDSLFESGREERIPRYVSPLSKSHWHK